MKRQYLKALARLKKRLQNINFSKVILSLLVFSFIFLTSITTSLAETEVIVIYQYNKDYYSDYNSAYEDISSLIKTEYPKGEEYFIAKEENGEWKLVDGFGKRILFKINPVVKEISKGKFVNGYKFTETKKNIEPIKQSKQIISKPSISTMSSNNGRIIAEKRVYVESKYSNKSYSDIGLEIEYDGYSNDTLSASVLHIMTANSSSTYADSISQKVQSGEYWARFVGKRKSHSNNWESVDLRTNSLIIEKGGRSDDSYITLVNSSSTSGDVQGYLDGTIYLMEKVKNYPPSIPDLTVPGVVESGKPFPISWGGSRDSEGDPISYILERSINNGGWSKVYSGSSTSTQETPLTSWNTINYRVKAYDGIEYSSYRTSPTITVTHNSNPTLSISSPGENSYFGKEKSINLQGSAKDVDIGDILTIKYTINGVSKHTNKELSPTLTSNNSNQSFTRSISIDDSIPQGDHTLKVWVEDNKGGKSSEVSRIIKIDKTNPTNPNIEANESWSKDNVTATIVSGTDTGSGVARTEYSLSGATTLSWTTYVSETTVSNQGKTIIKARTIDKVGNISNEVSKSIKIDKTPPLASNPVLSNIKSNSITVTTDATDSLSGLKSSETYLFNRDAEDITSFIRDKFVVDSNLKPNREYSYKYKAVDNVGNTSDYSLASKNYTLALNPVKVILKEVTGTSITLDLNNNDENINIPETIIELKEKGVNTTVSSSNWGIDTTKTLTGLIPGKEYEVYINTRNGDKLENGSIKIPNPDISFEDEFGNPIITITTVIPVENYKISGSSVNTLSVSWNQESNQEYQVFLKDEFNNEIAGSKSLWIKNNQHIFNNLPLPNTKYVPYITTRRVNSTSSLTPTKVLNEEKAYTNAEGISKGSFESGEDFVEVTLVLDSFKNPHDTEYELKNDVTGQVAKVLHSNPIWKNTNLAKESYYTYSVRAINKNNEPSYFTKLIFINGEDPHTYIPDLNINDDTIDKPRGDIIDLDELEDWDSDKPIWFNPEDLDGKEVKIDNEVFIVTKNKMATIKNKEKIEVANYAFSKEGFGFTDWKELKEGFFEDKIYFNQPGYYKTHFKFKNHVRESKPLILNYIADWIAPDIIAENKIKGQSVVTSNNFEIRLNAEDNVSNFLFYSIDDGKTYYHLKNNNSDIMFTGIEKTASGVQNNLRVKVVDICGNIQEKIFTIWGVDK